jgi:arginine repressor
MGKSGSELSKNQRQEMILNFLEKFGRHEGLATRQVFDLLASASINTTIRTVQRDLEELSIYHPIGEDTSSGEYRWVWMRSLEEERAMTDLRYRHLREIMEYFVRLREDAA